MIVKEFLKRHSIILVSLITMLFIVFKLFRDKDPKRSSSAVQHELRPLKVGQSPKPQVFAKSFRPIHAQRQITLSRLATGAYAAPAGITEQELELSLAIEPQARSCRLGDIDLIEVALGHNKHILVNVEDDTGELLLEEKWPIRRLREGVSLTFRLPRSSRLKVYRLMICSDGRTGHCRQSRPLDYLREEKFLTGQADALRKANSTLFYNFTIVSQDLGIQGFDVTKLRSDDSLRHFIDLHGGEQRNYEFLLKSLRLQSQLGAIPTEIKGTKLKLPLYYNDPSACRM